jgi:hypothetical protein
VLTEADVVSIKLLMVQGINDPELAAQFKVHNGTINCIRRLENWAHVLPQLKLPCSNGRPGANPGDDRSVKLTAELIPLIRQAAAAGQPTTAIAREFGVAVRTIQSILSGRSWKNY